MKTLILATLMISGFSFNAMALDITPVCHKTAAKLVERVSDGYDMGGFHAYDCKGALNNKAVVCGVSASKGDGAAMDTYRVVLNDTCNKAYRIELVAEE